MCTIQEFDMQCRGAVGLAEEWKEDHKNVEAVWRAEDIIGILQKCGDLANETCGHFISGQHPKLTLTIFHYFKSKADHFIVACNEFLSEATSWAAQNQYAIEGIAELQASVSTLSQDLRIAENTTAAAEAAKLKAIGADVPIASDLDLIAIEPPREWLEEPSWDR